MRGTVPQRARDPKERQVKTNDMGKEEIKYPTVTLNAVPDGNPTGKKLWVLVFVNTEVPSDSYAETWAADDETELFELLLEDRMPDAECSPAVRAAWKSDLMAEWDETILPMEIGTINGKE